MENKKSLVALALVALIGVVGATFAYFTSSATLTNEFTTGTYSTSVTEEFISPDNWTPGTTTTKKVNVTNNGSVDVAVRAKYTEKWTAEDGTILSGTRNGEKVAQFTIGSDWELANDGYYYYKGTLTSGQTSSDFISSVTFNPNFELEEGTDIECTTSTVAGKTTSSCTSLTSGYAGATYSLDITIETIQADKKWDYTIASTSQYVLSGTWNFNETVGIPETDYLTQEVSFTDVYGSSYDGFEVSVSRDGVLAPGTEYVLYIKGTRNGNVISPAFYGMTGWLDSTTTGRTIIFTSAQEVSQEFYEWFTANATKVS